MEREAREQELTSEERKALRQEKSVPIFDELEKWIKKEITGVLPKSAR